MYTLTFIKTKSKNFPEALVIATDLGAKYDGETVRLEVPTHQLLYMYEKLLPLLQIMSKWKDAEATYKGKKVSVYRFIFLIWRNVRHMKPDTRPPDLIRDVAKRDDLLTRTLLN